MKARPRHGYRCPGCNARLTYRFARRTTASSGVIVSRVHQCSSCLSWHDLKVTDPREADRPSAARANGEPA